VHGRVGGGDGIASAAALILDPVSLAALRHRLIGAAVLGQLLLLGV
jgi:hypothetical protein